MAPFRNNFRGHTASALRESTISTKKFRYGIHFQRLQQKGYDGYRCTYDNARPC